jgi:hypothetical protein
MSKPKEYVDVSDEEAGMPVKTDKDKTETAKNETDTSEYTDAGDIGDEQLPAGEIKTDKVLWDLDASKAKLVDLPKKVKDFVAGL